jgi:hypothetical protein
MNSTFHKPHHNNRVVNNDPWAVLIALATLIIAATIAAIIVVCILWKRYLRKRAEYEYSLRNANSKRGASLAPEYEVQVKILKA